MTQQLLFGAPVLQSEGVPGHIAHPFLDTGEDEELENSGKAQRRVKHSPCRLLINKEENLV